MNKEELTHLLEKVASGDISPEEAANNIRLKSYTDLGFAKVDKTKKAAEFVKKNIVKNVNYKKLSSDKLIKNTSNMLLVFDKYLQRK